LNTARQEYFRSCGIGWFSGGSRAKNLSRSYSTEDIEIFRSFISLTFKNLRNLGIVEDRTFSRKLSGILFGKDFSCRKRRDEDVSSEMEI